MSKQQRQTLLAMSDGMTTSEVARACGCTPSAAWDRLHGLRAQRMVEKVRPPHEGRSRGEPIRWEFTERGKRERVSIAALEARADA